MTHTGTRPIETPRLLLRRVGVNDALDMFERWAADPAVTRFMRWDPHRSPEESRTVIAQWIAGYAAVETYLWGITRKEDDRLIGSIGVFDIDANDLRGETGYCIGRSFWGQGFVAEALQAVIQYMFFNVGLNRLEAYHDVQNAASGAVMRKAGMVREGFARQKYRNSAGFHDCDLYAILRDDLSTPPLY